MTSIQERLRHSAKMVRLEWVGAYEDPIIATNLDVAADRIDALEAALRQIVAGDDGDYQDNDYGLGLAHGVRGAASIARGVLEASS